MIAGTHGPPAPGAFVARCGLQAVLDTDCAHQGDVLVATERVTGGGCFVPIVGVAPRPDRRGRSLGRGATCRPVPLWLRRLSPGRHPSHRTSARAVSVPDPNNVGPIRGMNRCAGPTPGPST